MDRFKQLKELFLDFETDILTKVLSEASNLDVLERLHIFLKPCNYTSSTDHPPLIFPQLMKNVQNVSFHIYYRNKHFVLKEILKSLISDRYTHFPVYDLNFHDFRFREYENFLKIQERPQKNLRKRKQRR